MIKETDVKRLAGMNHQQEQEEEKSFWNVCENGIKTLLDLF